MTILIKLNLLNYLKASSHCSYSDWIIEKTLVSTKRYCLYLITKPLKKMLVLILILELLCT